MRRQSLRYRRLGTPDNMVSFRVGVKETDLWVHATRPFKQLTRDLILRYRGYLEAYIEKYPLFAESLEPWYEKGPAPMIVRDMVRAGQTANVGPMAAVAGALAEQVGNGLLFETDEVMVENGGDIFIKTHKPVTVGIFAGRSPLSMKIGMRVECNSKPVGICTSSGTIGHSTSFGTADAVCVMAQSCALADASATAIANRVRCFGDIQSAIEFGKQISGIAGMMIIKGKAIGFWGEIEIIPLKEKKVEF